MRQADRRTFDAGFGSRSWRWLSNQLARSRRFMCFASQWFAGQKAEGGRRSGGLSAKGVVDLEWRLSKHLLPFFAAIQVDAITVEGVDRYRAAKVRERGRGRETTVDRRVR